MKVYHLCRCPQTSRKGSALDRQLSADSVEKVYFRMRGAELGLINNLFAAQA
uniref:Uncharacterized protein n=1 Tax=Pseudomonas syringae pv. actinidiae TaxID=103796 RepID=A0A286JZX0_PSESF|nr:hypothetical protein [Pseudomonas syringae pv. actinidiae]